MSSSNQSEFKARTATFPIVYKQFGEGFDYQRIVLFTNENEKSRDNIKVDESTFTILEKRKVSCNINMLQSILYHFNSHNPNLTLRMLNSMVSEHQNIKYIIIYLVKLNDEVEINGSLPGLEKLELLKLETPPVYISENGFDTYQQYEFLFSNSKGNQSFLHLTYQNIEKFYVFSHHMLRNLRHVLCNSLTKDDLTHILIFSSCTLYVNGIRSMNDIDILCWKPINELSHTAQKTLLDISQNKIIQLQHTSGKSKGQSFVDISIKGTDTWPHYWDIYLEKWASKCGATSFNEIVTSQQYHMRYLGLPITSLRVDKARRVLRNRASSLMDLVMLRKVLDYDFYIPSIPLFETKYIDKKDKSNEEINKLIEEGYTETNVELYKQFNIDRNRWLKTIQYYGKQRYKVTISIEELNSIIPRCEIIRVKK